MKPYYDHAGITIYHADCRDILPYLPKVDLVLTDPPYGVKRPSQRRAKDERFNQTSNPDGLVWVDLLPSTVALIREGGALYTFSSWERLGVWCLILDELRLRVRSCIVWDKMIHGLSDPSTCWAPRHEMILFAAKGRHELKNGRPKDIIQIKRLHSTKMEHPYQKPVEVLMVPLKHSTDTNSLVLDPFTGSGTTLVACQRMARKAIGIEIEEKYCEIAAQRLSQEVMAL